MTPSLPKRHNSVKQQTLVSVGGGGGGGGHACSEAADTCECWGGGGGGGHACSEATDTCECWEGGHACSTDTCECWEGVMPALKQQTLVSVGGERKLCICRNISAIVYARRLLVKQI